MGTALCIAAYMLMRTVEAFADVFHGILQMQWRLDIVGRSCIYRGAILLISFAVVYKVWGQLSAALLSMAVLTVLMFFLYDFRMVNRLAGISCRFSKKSLLNLSRDCLPVLAYSLLLNAIVLTARFFLERYHGEEMLGYYGSVSTIAVIVQAAANFILIPLNGIVSDYYAQGKQQEILKLSGKVILLLAVITGVALAGAAAFGNTALVLLFGKTIEPYTWLLIPTIFASCLTGLVWFLGMILIIMRKMRTLIIGAAAGATVSVARSVMLIPSKVFDGANTAVIAALITIVIVYATAIARSLYAGKYKEGTCDRH